MLIAAVTRLPAPVAAAAATRYDPRLRFSTISTPRFDIHFHQREEALARRLAAFVEAAAAEVDRAVGAAVGRVQIILVDQNDLSNGWATPLPYNTIEISAAPPPAESSIGNTRTGCGWCSSTNTRTSRTSVARAAGSAACAADSAGCRCCFPTSISRFGRSKGSPRGRRARSTREGRVVAGDFRVLLDRAAAAKRFEPLDRVNGGNVDWPGGNGRTSTAPTFTSSWRGSTAPIRSARSPSETGTAAALPGIARLQEGLRPIARAAVEGLRGRRPRQPRRRRPRIARGAADPSRLPGLDPALRARWAPVLFPRHSARISRR